jgi:hypothetical protein
MQAQPDQNRDVDVYLFLSARCDDGKKRNLQRTHKCKGAANAEDPKTATVRADHAPALIAAWPAAMFLRRGGTYNRHQLRFQIGRRMESEQQ